MVQAELLPSSAEARFQSKLFDHLGAAGGWAARTHRNFRDAPFADERLDQRAVRMKGLGCFQPRGPVLHFQGRSRVGVPTVLLFRFLSHWETRFVGGAVT